MYDKFSRVPAERVEAGDICAVCGIADIQVMIDGCSWNLCWYICATFKPSSFFFFGLI